MPLGMPLTKIFPIRFDNFKVPGDEMISKPDWEKYYPANDGKLANWALRSLLVVTGNRKILIDTGFGNKQDEGFFRPFHLNGDFSLAGQLARHGLYAGDITDVILTHLHFDHCGGCLLKEKDAIIPVFPKATLWVSKQQWESALHPVEKEVGSFLPENIIPLPDYYTVNFIEQEGSYLPNIYFKLVHGHTVGQIIPLVHVQDKIYLFGADLFPSTAHLDPGVNMAYDIDAGLATKEKEQSLTECLSNRHVIIFQHSLYIEACTLKQQTGRVVLDKIIKV
jgi:glyoxylase-like metal-dependent hydrolase (beta-lactamase superfamily II)